jgi:hypothetical protein
LQGERRVRREPASWAVATGVGYSFILMLGALGLQFAVHLFLPGTPVNASLCPFYAVATGRIVAAISDVLVYASAAYYNSARTSRVWEETQTNQIAKWTVAALVFATIIFDISLGGPIQTRIGAFILSAFVSGAAGAALSRRL